MSLYLDAIQARAKAAQTNQLEQLRAAVDRVRQLHQPGFTTRTARNCMGCSDVYPCATIRALDGGEQ